MRIASQGRVGTDSRLHSRLAAETRNQGLLLLIQSSARHSVLLLALSASFLPQRLQGHAEQISTVALPEPGSPGAHASVPRCPQPRLKCSMPCSGHRRGKVTMPVDAAMMGLLRSWSPTLQAGAGKGMSWKLRWGWARQGTNIQSNHSAHKETRKEEEERVQVGAGVGGEKLHQDSPARDWQLVERWKGVSLSLQCGSVIPSQLGDSFTAQDGPEEEGGTPASRRKGDR